MEYVLIFVLVYFLPTLIAWHRKAENRTGIGLLNLLLGWLFIPWVIALIWAVKEKK